MGDILLKSVAGTMVKYALKKRSIQIAMYAVCATGAFYTAAQAQSWLNNTIGSVTGQVEQGVEQHILGNGTQPQQSTPAASPPQQPYPPPASSNGAYGQYGPSWEQDNSNNNSNAVPACTSENTYNSGGYVHHIPCNPNGG